VTLASLLFLCESDLIRTFGISLSVLPFPFCYSSRAESRKLTTRECGLEVHLVVVVLVPTPAYLLVLSDT